MLSSGMASSLTPLAVYRRTVQASTERVWENVHDWEHLPWLHRSSFCSIERVDSGDWGWRARIGLQPASEQHQIELELVIEPDEPRYVSRTLAGPGAGTEIWTRVEALDPHQTAIEVEFLAPDVDPAAADARGQAFVRLYTRLWDEDEAMMMRRHEQLADLRKRPAPAHRGALALGRLDDLRAHLPLVVQHDGRNWRIVELDGELVAHSTVCPHQLGPLEDAPLEDGCVTCPWHGHRFEVRSGRCVDGSRLQLGSAPTIRINPATSDVQLVSAQLSSAS